MTKIESIIFNIVETLFGTWSAVKFLCFCSTAFISFVYMMYLFTLPFRFVSMVISDLIEKKE